MIELLKQEAIEIRAKQLQLQQQLNQMQMKNLILEGAKQEIELLLKEAGELKNATNNN